MQPTVTIGVPVYNGATYLREALDSALAQTFTDFEILISDNASTDDTESICRDYCAKDSRVRYIRQSENIGAFSNFRFLPYHARGAFFTWLAHDDTLLPHFANETVCALMESEEIALVSCDFKIIHSDESIATAELAPLRRHRSRLDRECVCFDDPDSVIRYGVYGTFRTRVLRDSFQSLSAPKLAAGKEFELPLLARCAARGEVFSVPSVARVYNYHASNTGTVELSRLRSKSKFRQVQQRSMVATLVRFDLIRTISRADKPTMWKIRILSVTLLAATARILRKAKNAIRRRLYV